MTASSNTVNFTDKVVLFLARGFGSGCLPVAPGTWGSMVGVLLFLLTYIFFAELPIVFNLLVLLVIVAAVPVCQLALKHYSGSDPSEIVYDEIAGQFLALLPVYWFMGPQNLYWGLAGAFILFRFFDITKLFPVNYFEKLPGGWGVAVDDLAAGVYAAIFLLCIAAFLPVLFA